MTGEQARRRFITARVARLATVGGDGRPHLVPIVFALTDETIVSAIDAKPKRSPALRRLANIATNPHVAVLADHYEDDWDRLWWVRADGTGRALDPAEPEAVDAVARLGARYPQYRRQPPGLVGVTASAVIRSHAPSLLPEGSRRPAWRQGR